MSNIRFVATALAGSNKTGVLRPDANGYYRMYVGALNMLNSSNMFYPFEAAKHIFMDQSSEFLRRVKNRALRGELGHPKFLPGMTEAQFFARLLAIHETNICAFFKEIILDFDNSYDDKGNKVIGILADLMPDGPQGHVVQKQIDNPDANCCWSIRSFTKDYPVGNIIHRDIKKVVTFDNVNEPGISIAKKTLAPGLEDHHILEMQDTQTMNFTQGTVEEAIRASKTCAALENAVISGADLFKQFGWSQKEINHIEQRANKAAWSTW